VKQTRNDIILFSAAYIHHTHTHTHTQTNKHKDTNRTRN